MNSVTSFSLTAILATSLSLVAENELGPGLLGMPLAAPKEAQRFTYEPILLEPGVTKLGLHFTALRDGKLEELSFLSVGQALNQSSQPAFEVEIFESDGSSPGKSLGKSSEAVQLNDGPRMRRAMFPEIQLKKGTTYLASISRPASATGTLSLHQTYNPGREFSRDSVDTKLLNPGYGLFVSTDGGISWTEESGKLIPHGVRIGDQWQGWAYDTSFWDGLRIFKSEAEEQVIAQTLKLDLPEGESSAKPTGITVALRSSPALAGQTLELQAKILSQENGAILAEGTLAAIFANATTFQTVEIPFSKSEMIKQGTQLVLLLGLTSSYSKTPEDFLFTRSPTYSFANPKPSELTWQGAESAAYLLPSFELPNDQKPVNTGLIDLPFVLKYEAK